MYHDQRAVFESMSDEEAGKIIKSIFAYSDGEEHGLTGLMLTVFEQFRSTLDRDLQKWQKVVDRNRANGQRGGRPKNPVGYSGNPDEPKEPDSDSDSDSVTESVNEETTSVESGESVQTSPTPKPSPLPPKNLTVASAPPTADEVAEWARKWGVDKKKNVSAVKKIAEDARQYYERMEWVDAKGSKVKSWKRKIAGVWLTEEKLGKHTISQGQGGYKI